jgi:hypothetical protein
MIFHDAWSTLNPVFPVGWQISESLRGGAGMSKADAMRRAIELMDLVKIPSATARVKDYPHQFSGGMRQRLMIAMALATDPKALIADEPAAALDVTVQAQIIDLLADPTPRLGHGPDPHDARRGRRRRRPIASSDTATRAASTSAGPRPHRSALARKNGVRPNRSCASRTSSSTFPSRAAFCSSGRSGLCERSTGSASSCIAAKSLASWANRAAASPRSPGF